ncbi:MAG: D-glycero-beta-D-manno-heptose-7-phosphate kinase [Rhodoferax sp.]|jgi:rfaE bifunctional protein kinase chain/domain|uniref:D-glycero-beta-D-manno-heptose-7-phosphate kinase n=1 Tax=Rhodoferax sp. TaxID=50421 RepID=UPI001B3FEC41|nr:D-glycero-beta-D-manno-heptose-7-phosphate kinase [Rhodoferax sp.]MBP8285843.1 D-glycero-beta-D-manno-heptose-7-phosphate kinase [Rhodoferax sp.]MBP9147274.1 D-glycero-beta-D-manno-heptose-7-phosphate kinase [Rhodoferax sp.]MBP9735427.1 D-glycero-beta-D-manno-heptose-7-phosphate kinase [Rhodoferax sp.]
MTISKDTLANTRILVVGDVMLDRYWYGAVDRISPEAPVPVVRVSREEERIGAAANVAFNVVTLGAQASLLTVVGDDDASHKLEALVAKTGIRTYFGRDAQLNTTVKLRVIGRQQQLIRLDFENTPKNEILASQTAQFNALLPLHDAVLFSDYGKGGLAHVVDMITHARSAGKPILIDPKGSDYARYQGATVITPNRAELQQVVGGWDDEADLSSKAQNLRTQLGLQAVLLTRSEEGMTLFDALGQLSVSAQAREVFDVTGAGDTVIATMAAMAAAGLSLRDALPLANRAGGLVVGKFGTATVSYEELFA